MKINKVERRSSLQDYLPRVVVEWLCIVALKGPWED